MTPIIPNPNDIHPIMMGLKDIVVGNIVLLIVWIFHMVYFTLGVKTV